MDRLVRRMEREALLREVAQARAARRHERAVLRRERVLVRARRAVPFHGALAVGAAILAWPFADGWLAVTAVAGAMAVRSAAVVRHPPPLPELPAVAAPPPPLPGRDSAAWPLVVRLERVRGELTRLLPLVGPSGRDVAQHAWQAASEADTALRWQAARLGAVEPHRGAEPALLHALSEGVEEQERLVEAMADLVAASDPALPGGPARLRDAADALHGLAHGLRQVR